MAFNRISTQFPPGLEKVIRARAAKSGVSLASYFSHLAARGLQSEERQEMVNALDDVALSLNRIQLTSIGSTSGPAGIPDPVLRVLADIYARTQLAAAASKIDSSKIDILAAHTLNNLRKGS